MLSVQTLSTLLGAFSTIIAAASPDVSEYDACTFLVDRLEVDPEMDVIPPEFNEIAFDCELNSNLILPLLVDLTQRKSLEEAFFSGELRSSESTIILKNSGFTITNEGIQILPGHKIQYGKIPNERRRLATPTGVKHTLVVKVTDSGGLARSESTETISQDIFGGFDDNLNLKSQMEACSFGKLTITAGDPPTNSAKENEVSPGVIEVTIPISLKTNNRYKVNNAVRAAVETKLGFQLPGPYDLVMFVLEECYVNCDWAAFAYINSWLSVYRGWYYMRVGTQMHGKFDLLS